MRRSIGQYVRLAGSQSPVGMNIEINARGLMEYCARKQVSCTPVVMKVISRVSATYPVMNALPGWDLTGRKMFIPEDVDVGIAIEKTRNDEIFVMTPVVRSVNKKTVAELSREIEHLTNLPFEQMPDIGARRLLNTLPGFVQYLVLKCLCQSPRLFKKYFGTIGLSNLGRLGIVDVFPVWLNTLVFGMGTIVERPVAEAGQIRVAPVLHLAVCFNHAVLDGAMAGRILQEIKQRLESPLLLDEIETYRGDGKRASGIVDQ